MDDGVLLFGVLTEDVVEVAAEIPAWEEPLGQSGVVLTTHEGYLAFIFVMFAVAVSLYAATHITALRDEEGHGRLDLVFSHPHGRREWLLGRIAVAVGATLLLALLGALSAWVGTALRGSGISLWRMLETGLNMVPLALSFLGVGVLLYGLIPRLAGPLLFGLIPAAFAWDLVGELLDVPAWVLGLSPFHHQALLPAATFDATATTLMLAIGAVATAVGVELFRRRDIAGA